VSRDGTVGRSPRLLLLETVLAVIVLGLAGVLAVFAFQPDRTASGIELSSVLRLGPSEGEGGVGGEQFSEVFPVLEAGAEIHFNELSFELVDHTGVTLASTTNWTVLCGTLYLTGDNDTFDGATGLWEFGGSGLVLAGGTFTVVMYHTNPSNQNDVLLAVAHTPLIGSIADVLE
jgi:hypothetical protein